MASKKQVAFIRKIQGSSPERENRVHAFLKENGIANLEDLSQKDASTLIDSLLEIKVEGEDKTRGLTPKQLSFLESLIRDEPRRKEAERYLKSHGLKTLNGLSLDQGSDLIETLKAITVETPKSSRFVSEKQKRFIESLIEKTGGEKVASDFLRSKGIKSIEDLTGSDASALIDLLRTLQEMNSSKTKK